MCPDDSFKSEIITKKSIFLNNIHFYYHISYNLYTNVIIHAFINKQLKIKSSKEFSIAEVVKLFIRNLKKNGNEISGD